jgi:uncharacterized membrane protein
VLSLAKIVFIPYLIVVLYAMILAKETLHITGNSLFEEYLVVMSLMLVYEIQERIIKWYTT